MRAIVTVFDVDATTGARALAALHRERIAAVKLSRFDPLNPDACMVDPDAAEAVAGPVDVIGGSSTRGCVGRVPDPPVLTRAPTFGAGSCSKRDAAPSPLDEVFRPTT